jgi:hypothetical protein
MNRLNQTEPAIYLSLSCSEAFKVPFPSILQPINITNVGGVTKSIHEDTTAAVTLLTIATSDANTVDKVTCFVNETASSPTNNGIFSAVETDTGTNSTCVLVFYKEKCLLYYSKWQNLTIIIVIIALHKKTLSAEFESYKHSTMKRL